MKRTREGSGLWVVNLGRRLCVSLMWTVYHGLCFAVWLGFQVALGFRHKSMRCPPEKSLQLTVSYTFASISIQVMGLK